MVCPCPRFAICPIVEGTLIRTLVRMGESVATAQAVLDGVRSHARCEFWPDSVSYVDTDLTTVVSHRHVTDTYLANLARVHAGLLATLDVALSERHPDHCVLVPDG